MTPQLPFDEFGIVLATMTTGVQFFYFLIITGLNLLGLYISDREIDKKQTNGKTYEYEWSELAPYALVSAIFTMSILEMFDTPFWQAMVYAVLMGMIFRSILPELTKVFAEKIKSLISTIFGQSTK